MRKTIIKVHANFIKEFIKSWLGFILSWKKHRNTNKRIINSRYINHNKILILIYEIYCDNKFPNLSILQFLSRLSFFLLSYFLDNLLKNNLMYKDKIIFIFINEHPSNWFLLYIYIYIYIYVYSTNPLG